MEFNQRLNLYKELIENYLGTYFSNHPKTYDKLIKSMEYSLMAGGKRLRPALVLEFCRVCGGDDCRGHVDRGHELRKPDAADHR